MNKISMYPPIGSGLPIRTFESANDTLTLTGVLHATYDVTLEMDGVIRDNFTLEVKGDEVINIDITTSGPTTRFSVVGLSSTFNAVGDGSVDNFNPLKNYVLATVNNPLTLSIPEGDFYLKGPDNGRIEAWPSKSKGIELLGNGGTLYPVNNRTSNKHEHYVMQLDFAEGNQGAYIQDILIDGSRNNGGNILGLFDINPDPFGENNVVSSQIPLQRGIYVTGAKELIHKGNTYRDMYGGYTLMVSGTPKVVSENNIYDGVGGNNWTENFGMAFYVGGTAGDTVVDINNDKAQGLISPTDASKMSWIGFVLENGTVQVADRTQWRVDKNTHINITDTDYLDFETGYHLETQAGNVYLNIWGGHVRVKNYMIASGIKGECRVRVYDQVIDFIPNKRGDFFIQGILYTENEESKNDAGLNSFEFYNCTLNYPSTLNKDGTKFNPALSYADNSHVKLYNCTLNNVPDRLVQNASATLVDCEINLAEGNTRTTLEQIKGDMSKPEQAVVLTRTNINPHGAWQNAVAGAEPAKVKNEGYVAPELLEPIGAAGL